jgi:hypothetical protein
MICPNCHSSDLKSVSLVHAAGLHESRGGLSGFFLGNTDGLLFGRYRGTSQSRLSAMVRHPRKVPYTAPVILWLLGFFPLMAFAGRGKLSWAMGLLAAAYLLLLPALPIGALVYNSFVYPKKHTRWQRTFMCQCCGALIEPHSSTQSRAQA